MLFSIRSAPRWRGAAIRYKSLLLNTLKGLEDYTMELWEEAELPEWKAPNGYAPFKEVHYLHIVISFLCITSLRNDIECNLRPTAIGVVQLLNMT